jgi:DDE superfamily endonuclease
LVLPAIERSGPIEAWIIDDTGFPKKGAALRGGDPTILRSARQAGQLPSRGIAVARQSRRQPAGRRPAVLAGGVGEGRGAAGQGQEPALAKAGVPDTIEFQTKPKIALEQIKSAYEAGLPQGVVLMDAGYGNDTDLRTQVTALGLSYVAGIGANIAVWPPGTAPLPPLPGSGRGRPPKLLRRDGKHHPVSVKTLAHELPEAWHNITWREGSADWLASRFAPSAGAAGASRHLASRAACRGVVADRVAARRARAGQILAFHQAQRHRLRSPRRFGEIALADRARLSGTPTGARLWRLRRAWVARLPPPRHTLYRRLRLPDRRTRRPSPLRIASHPALLGICPSRRLPTPRRR